MFSTVCHKEVRAVLSTQEICDMANLRHVEFSSRTPDELASPEALARVQATIGTDGEVSFSDNPPDIPILIAFLVTKAIELKRSLVAKLGHRLFLVSPHKRNRICVTRKILLRHKDPVVTRVYFDMPMPRA